MPLQLEQCISLVTEIPLEIAYAILQILPTWFLSYLISLQNSSNEKVSSLGEFIEDIVSNRNVIITNWYSSVNYNRQISVNGKEFELLCDQFGKSDNEDLWLSSFELRYYPDHYHDKSGNFKRELLDSLIEHTKSITLEFQLIKKLSEKPYLLKHVTSVIVRNMTSFRVDLKTEKGKQVKQLSKDQMSNVSSVIIRDYISSVELETLCSFFDNLRYIRFESCWFDIIESINKLELKRQIIPYVGCLHMKYHELVNGDDESINFIIQYAHELFITIEPDSSSTIKLEFLQQSTCLTDMHIYSDKTKAFSIKGTFPSIKTLEISGISYICEGLINFPVQFPGLTSLIIKHSPVNAKIFSVNCAHACLRSLELNYPTQFESEHLILNTKSLKRLSIKRSNLTFDEFAFVNCHYLDCLFLGYDDGISIDINSLLYLRYLNISGNELMPTFPLNLVELNITYDGQEFKQVKFPSHLKLLTIMFSGTLKINFDSSNLYELNDLTTMVTGFTNYNLKESVIFTKIPKSLKVFKCYTKKVVFNYNFGMRARQLAKLLRKVNWNEVMEKLYFVVGKGIIVPKHWIRNNKTNFDAVIRDEKFMFNSKDISYIEVFSDDQFDDFS